MRFRWMRTVVAAGVLTGAGALTTWADPILDPMTCEIVTGTSATCPADPNFTSPSAGIFALWVQNGDDGAEMVSSGSISVNGAMVVGDAAFASGRPLFARPVSLLAGNNTLSITINGDPGQFVTVMILRRGERPDVTIGRLLLPYSSATNLVLDLKNGSPVGGRRYRVVFFDTTGSYVADSGYLLLGPRASLSQDATAFMVNGGSWTSGSIEVFYAGRGRGRLFGLAASTDATTGIGTIVALEHAGSRVLDPHAQAN
jgi:hypothetical protein